MYGPIARENVERLRRRRQRDIAGSDKEDGNGRRRNI